VLREILHDSSTDSASTVDQPFERAQERIGSSEDTQPRNAAAAGPLSPPSMTK
jgi:hypothetical protein